MQTVIRILTTTRSALVAFGVAASVFALGVWLPNLQLLSILWSSSASLADKIMLPVRLLASITTNFTPLSAFYTVVIAVLSGINVALIVELIRARQMFTEGALAGVSGIAAGALGLGCAACGSLILVALVGTAGANALAFLPLGGSEFGILGVLLAGYSTHLLSKQINKTTCDIV